MGAFVEAHAMYTGADADPRWGMATGLGPELEAQIAQLESHT